VDFFGVRVDVGFLRGWFARYVWMSGLRGKCGCWCWYAMILPKVSADEFVDSFMVSVGCIGFFLCPALRILACFRKMYGWSLVSISMLAVVFLLFMLDGTSKTSNVGSTMIAIRKHFM
jgi:hypothetical protein